ncbi:MarR family winged helix-turn-helix transcriptional regulator [Sporolactobacillus spathodeae]|uniref:DNA-binding MarR family transcriptional regulator n=1 Tax=Sporolactobacillus spathodeae TaxID=1465502 RepID=A0ABS2Q9Q7_9BACL|nr:MarR family transcriptional regulator [Sporolactobacillus spathodeae]MBM7658055.1 DNA-binding MarR family transcriptional regulator [Sporolactobacillus spathodeae]
MDEQIIKEITQNYYRILDLDSSDDKEKVWMARRFSGNISGLTTLCYHMIDLIWRHPGTNGKTICEHSDVLQGTVSKVISRLIRVGLVTVQTGEKDRRDRYYSLTALGEELAQIHAAMHQLKDKKIEAILTQFNAAERDTIAAFVKKMLELEQSAL